MYNFHKKTRSINEIVFYHEFFKKDHPEMLIKIVRKSNPASEQHHECKKGVKVLAAQNRQLAAQEEQKDNQINHAAHSSSHTLTDNKRSYSSK